MITTITQNGVTFNRAGTASSWRLIYANGATSSTLTKATGYTDTINNIEEFPTEREGIYRIEDLGLTRI